MSSISSIATSGTLAAEQRLQVSAENVANASSDAPAPPASGTIQAQSPPAYAPQHASQVATPSGGTLTPASNAQPGQKAASNPAPSANSGGQAAAPNVDLAVEMLQQQIAQIEFMSNAEVARVYSQMMQTLLNGGS
jgi:flagellar basal body rod protein FlgC